MSQDDESHVSPQRRRVIAWIARGFLSIWALGTGWIVAAFLKPPHTRRSLAQRTLGAGKLDELPVGEGRLVRSQREPIFVARTGDQELVAVSAVCTHLHCILHYDRDAQQLLCPCHSAAFDLNGNVLSGPAPRPLQRFPVDTQMGEIVVHLGGHSGGEA